MRNIVLSFLLLMSLTVAGSYFELVQAQEHKHDIWYCPMHPNYTSDKPGSCPICGMNLVKRQKNKEQSLSKTKIEGYAPVHITTHQQQLMGVRTELVTKRTLTKTIRASGYVSTNRDLYMIQDEYVKTYSDFVATYPDYRRFIGKRRNWETHRDLNLKMYQVEDKLLSLGLGPDQIKELQKNTWRDSWDQKDLLFLKNTGHYWVVAQVYENDLLFVKAGTQVDVDINAYEQKTKGFVRSVAGNIDTATRTASVLIELNNYEGPLLKGNMFVNVLIPTNLGEVLTVPRDAIMDTGLRKLVFIKKVDGVFEPREIQTGLQADEGIEVSSGLNEGERIAVGGNFLLDSESRLQSAFSAQGGGQ